MKIEIRVAACVSRLKMYIVVMICSTLLISCSEVSDNIRLNELARSLDYSCFLSKDSLSGVIDAGVQSEFTPGRVTNTLKVRVITSENRLHEEIPERFALKCSVLLYQSMPSDFSRIIADLQFGRSDSNVYRTLIQNDTVYYLESQVGFPIDSIRMDEL